MINSVLDQQATSYMQLLRGYTLSGTVHSKAVLRYVAEFRESVISSEIAEVKRARYNTEGSGSNTILLQVEQSLFVQNLDCSRASDIPNRVDRANDNWDFEGLVTVKKWPLLAFLVSFKRHSASAGKVMRQSPRLLSQ